MTTGERLPALARRDARRGRGARGTPVGVGYRAELKEQSIHLLLGFSHPIVYQLPEAVTAKVEKQTLLTFSSTDKQILGEVCAQIRALRPPEPYKGKGIRYSDEHVRRKAGKAAGAAGS